MTNLVSEALTASQSDGFSYEMNNGIAVITINFEDEAVNTLKLSSLNSIQTILAEITRQKGLKGIIVISAKADCFIAGADVHMINDCENIEQAQSLSRLGQDLFTQIEVLPVPVVAAINGSCMGGGLELALACSARIITDSPKTILAMPEVKLGLLPGSGGTQRLPALIGLTNALPIMLTGKQIRPKQALAMALVDDIVPQSILLDSAIKLIGQLRPMKSRIRSRSFIDHLMIIPLVKQQWLQQAKKQVLKQTNGHYPAPLKIIELLSKKTSEPYQAEAKAFAELVMTGESKSLRHLFFTSTDLKKAQVQKYQQQGTAIKQLLVLGGGLMGCGIAAVSVMQANVAVRLKDNNQQALLNAKNSLNRLLSSKVKRKFIRPFEKEQQLNMLSTCQDYSTAQKADMVVEAVFEELSLKQQMLKELEPHINQDTIFASNTSSISIAEIASGSKYPENVIGLHYFSPVDKMPLVEVIPHDLTSEQCITSTLDFARQQGKTPIVVKDSAGFYVNRILAPYIKQVLALIKQGVSIEAIDKALVDFGFPIGPCALLDQVGIDIAAKISPLLVDAFGERFAGETILEQMLEKGFVGKKSGKGFYLYQQKNGLDKLSARVKLVFKQPVSKQMNPVLNDLFAIDKQTIMEPKTIVQRCLFPMLNEAARCLDEDIISSKADGDIGAVYGMGFPPFLGGPFFYIEKQGEALLQQMSDLANDLGESYAPCPALKGMIDLHRNQNR